LTMRLPIMPRPTKPNDAIFADLSQDLFSTIECNLTKFTGCVKYFEQKRGLGFWHTGSV
jgi:hypothetical protein